MNKYYKEWGTISKQLWNSYNGFERLPAFAVRQHGTNVIRNKIIADTHLKAAIPQANTYGTWRDCELTFYTNTSLLKHTTKIKYSSWPSRMKLKCLDGLIIPSDWRALLWSGSLAPAGDWSPPAGSECGAAVRRFWSHYIQPESSLHCGWVSQSPCERAVSFSRGCGSQTWTLSQWSLCAVRSDKTDTVSEAFSLTESFVCHY